MRSFGPGRSWRIATGRPARPAASRTSCAVSACSSCVPWVKFSRATSMPAVDHPHERPRGRARRGRWWRRSSCGAARCERTQRPVSGRLPLGARPMTSLAPMARSDDEILAAVRAIPRGHVTTYGDLSPGAPRRAGAVLAANADPDAALAARRARRRLAGQGRAPAPRCWRPRACRFAVRGWTCARRGCRGPRRRPAILQPLELHVVRGVQAGARVAQPDRRRRSAAPAAAVADRHGVGRASRLRERATMFACRRSTARCRGRRTGRGCRTSAQADLRA